MLFKSSRILLLWCITALLGSSLSFGESCLDRYSKVRFSIYDAIQQVRYGENLQLAFAARSVLGVNVELEQSSQDEEFIEYFEEVSEYLRLQHALHLSKRDLALLIHLADQYGLLCNEKFGYPMRLVVIKNEDLAWYNPKRYTLDLELSFGRILLAQDIASGKLLEQIFVSYVSEVVGSLTPQAGITDLGDGEIDNPRDEFSQISTDIHSKLTAFLGSKDHEALEVVSRTVGRKSRNLNSTYWQGWMAKADLFLTSQINDQIRYRDLPKTAQFEIAKLYSMAVFKFKYDYPRAFEVIKPTIKHYIPADLSNSVKNQNPDSKENKADEKTEILSRVDSGVAPEAKVSAAP